MTVKSLEQRIIERAQSELRGRVSEMVCGLRNQLRGTEGETITHLIAVDGPDQVLYSIDQLLTAVEDLVFKAAQARYCDKALDSALASLESDLAYRQGAFPQAAHPPVGIPPAPAPAPVPPRNGY